MRNSTVAKLTECMWRMKKYKQAVKPASRELSISHDDNDGQSQARWNLGLSLHDCRKKHEAVDALKQSTFLAEKAGNIKIFKGATLTLNCYRKKYERRARST